eukprot:1137889-Pelagomonas_calceolata.AAC.4
MSVWNNCCMQHEQDPSSRTIPFSDLLYSTHPSISEVPAAAQVATVKRGPGRPKKNSKSSSPFSLPENLCQLQQQQPPLQLLQQHGAIEAPRKASSSLPRGNYSEDLESQKAARFRFSSRSLTGLSGSMLVGISIGAGVQVITVGTHVATAAALVSYAQPQMPPSTTHISMENFPNQGFVFVPQHPATHTIRKITIYLGHFFSGRWQGVLSNGHVHAEKGAAPGGRFMRGLLMVPVR